MGLSFSEILNNLKNFEKKFNETKYPPETAFLPSFSSQIQKTERYSFKHYLPAFEIDEFFEKVEQ